MRPQPTLTQLPFDSEKMIAYFREKHPDEYESFIRANTPNYLECGVEYFYRSRKFLLENCDILHDKLLYNFKLLDFNLNNSSDRIQFSSTEKEVFERIRRVDEAVEFKENIIDSGRFKNYVGDGYNATLQIRKPRYSNRLSVQVVIWNNITGDTMTCSYRIGEGWSITLIHKNKNLRDNYIGRYFTRIQAEYLVREWVMTGSDDSFNTFGEGDPCVFMSKHRSDFTYGKTYTCLEVGADLIKVMNDLGTTLGYNRHHFMPLAVYRKIRLQQLDLQSL